MENKRQKLDEKVSKKQKVSLQQEFNFFDKSNDKSKRLKLIEEALKTIRPSSCESERLFSNVSRFLTKFRTRLSDNNLNALVVLRHYHLSLKAKK